MIMEFSTLHDLQGCRARCFIITHAHRPVRAPLPSSPPGALVPAGLVEVLSRVPDPREPWGVRYRLATLLAVGVCVMTSAGHNSLTSMAEWARRRDQAVLARLGRPYDPFTGRFTAPGERTLRDVFGKVDAAALTQAGFARLTALTPSSPCATAPDGVREREQRRAHRAAAPQQGDARPSRWAFAVDGKCLRRAVRADGSRVFILTAVRHDDTLTAALREIGAKTNEIPDSPRSSTRSTTPAWPTPWSPWTPCTHRRTTPATSSNNATPTTCCQSRTTSPSSQAS
ncbi:hypothetical protein BV882_26855 [Streptomyces sp. 46]|nr:hypothetical protein BV882_26855 [Streptomyces sp. 46]